jgi:hypothetical protein
MSAHSGMPAWWRKRPMVTTSGKEETMGKKDMTNNHQRMMTIKLK